MSAKRNDLINELNLYLDAKSFEDYAPNGLQIEGKDTLKKIAFAVSATHESLQQAIAWGADALIVHHGIFWKYQGAKTITGAWGERAKLCIKNDLNLIAYHLPLDAHMEVGNAKSLADLLHLHEVEPFAAHKRQFLGVKGKITPTKASELKVKLEKLLNHTVTLATHNEDAMISNIGIITGGANNDWVKAQEDGLDAYLTGEISEYNWHDAREAEIHYFAGGHHATEKFGIQSLAAYIKTKYPAIEIKFFDSANPA